MKIFELFSGIGAPRKALEKAGIQYESLGYSEIDKYASASYETMYNDSNNYGDITKIEQLPKGIDLLFHGSPCQDFSIAGKGVGAVDGSRSNLMFETVRLVTDALPKVVVWENVKGVLSAKHKPAFDKYLQEMEKLGYTNHYQVLNAKDYGIAQNRERIFVVSALNNDALFRFPEKIKLETCLGDYLDASFGIQNIMFDPNDKKKFRTFTWVGNAEKTIEIKTNTKKGFDNAEKGDGIDLRKSQTITTSPNLGVVDDMTIARVDGVNYDVSSRISNKNGIQHCQKISDNNTTRVIDKIEIVGRVDSMKYDYTSKILAKENISNCLTASMGLGGGFETKVVDNIEIVTTVDGLNFDNDKAILSKDGVQKCQRSGNNTRHHVIDNLKVQNKVIKFGNGDWEEIPERLQHLEIGTYLVIRKLKPIECWRLMGFEDGDFEKASQVCSNSQLYKQAGNSIVTNVLVHLFKEMKEQGIL